MSGHESYNPEALTKPLASSSDGGVSAGVLTLAEAREKTWDIVVIGTGMGGATAGYRLASQGREVLFLEKGLFLFGDHDRGRGELQVEGDDPNERMAHGWWPSKIHGTTSYASYLQMFFPLGCGTGGSSAVFAAQLERMQPCDFEPRKYHPDVKDAALVDAWPFTYEDMVPYYREAERLFHVTGTPDPLNPDPEPTLDEPPPMSERDAYIFEQMKKGGMHPYRAHVGCRFIQDCKGCGAALCPKPCKADSGRLCLLPAIERHAAKVLAEAEVLRLEATAERVTAARVSHRGEEAEIRGNHFIVAAGALMTPALLLRSSSDVWPKGLANRSDQVGRNLMFHAADFVAIRPPKVLDPTGPHKAISATDLYLRSGKKMGTFQSMGIPVFASAIESFLKSQAERNPKWYLTVGGTLGRKVASKVGASLFGHANVFSTMVEDLPYAHNRILLDPSAPNGMRFHYDYPEELRARCQLYRDELRKLLPKELKMLVLNDENNLNFGHTSGTARAGSDPIDSVVDAQQRAHDLENLWVADASAFPASGGINPSLTIAANALRVADAVHGHLASQERAPALPVVGGLAS